MSSEAGPAIRRQVLILCTALWGTTFILVKVGRDAGCGPFTFVSLRFALAAAFLFMLRPGAVRGTTQAEASSALAIGVLIAGGYGLQTLGLATIPSSRSAFLTAFFLPLVPVVYWMLASKRPDRMQLAGLFLAFAGLMALTLPGWSHGDLGTGDLATLVATVLFALEVVLIGRFAAQVDARRVALLQLGTASAVSAVLAIVCGEGVPHPSPTLVGVLVVLATMTAFLQFAVNWAQAGIGTVHATTIYAAETAWAAGVGMLVGETLAPLAILGAGLIAAGIVVGAGRRTEKVAGDFA